MERSAAATPRPARPTPTYRLRRWAAVGLAALAFVIATVDSAAEPAELMSEFGAGPPNPSGGS